MAILNVLKMWLPSDQSVSLLGLYSKKIIIRSDKTVCTRVLNTMLFIIVTKENGIKIGDWLHKLRYTNTNGYATHSEL